MKNYKVKIGDDIVVELTETEIHKVHDYYETECMAEFIAENYAKDHSLSDKEINEIANEALRQKAKYGYDEKEAIQEELAKHSEKKQKREKCSTSKLKRRRKI